MKINFSPRIPGVYAYLFEPKRFKGAKGGRAGCKSETFARALLKKGTIKPLKILCGREYQNSIKDSVKALLDRLIKDYHLEPFYRSTKNEIIGINGTAFIFSGLKTNTESIKSMDSVDILWIEEAQTTSQQTLDIIVPTIRKPGSEIWFSYNQKDEEEPVDTLLKTHPDAILKHINYDHPDVMYFLPQTVIDMAEYWRTKRPDDFDHIWRGYPKTINEAVVFSGKWIVEEFEPRNDEIFYHGADWGFSQDPAAILRCFVREEEKRIYIDYESAGIGISTRDMPTLFDVIPTARTWPITADSARPEMINHMNEEGFNVNASKKGKGSVQSGIDWLKGYTIVVHHRCKEVQDELRLYKYKVDKGGRVLPILVDEHNHFIDALRYALEDFIKGGGDAVICV